jgi:hypothetical protein
LELQVEDAQGNLLYSVKHRASPLQRYFIYAQKVPKISPLEIKPSHVGETRRYKLIENKMEILTLQQTSSYGEFFIRDSKRNRIARFIPIGPEKILLLSSTEVIARLRFLKYPLPEGFRIFCDADKNQQWIFATIMYAIAQIEIARQKQVSTSNNENRP